MPAVPSTWSVRPVRAEDEERWSSLYGDYRTFYRLEPDPRSVTRAWRWLLGGEHGLRGLVAVDAHGTIGALANLRLFARPSAGRMGLYLDDLFTDPAHRRNGLAALLLEEASALAAAEDASVVRWITAADNTAARSVYDVHATATPWVTYDMVPRPSDEPPASARVPDPQRIEGERR